MITLSSVTSTVIRRVDADGELRTKSVGHQIVATVHPEDMGPVPGEYRRDGAKFQATNLSWEVQADGEMSWRYRLSGWRILKSGKLGEQEMTNSYSPKFDDVPPEVTEAVARITRQVLHAGETSDV